MPELKVAVSEEDHVQGAASAKVTLVEYGDFQCPDAGASYPMVKKLQKRFGEKLRFVYRHFPLDRIHPMAEPAAELAEYAAAQGKFWEMHDALFEQQRGLSLGMLGNTAQGLGLDRRAADAAVEDQTYGERIDRDVEGGTRSGVHGTPTFFINGERYEGEWEYEELAGAIDAAI